jgi:hypothetical protein
VILTLGLVIGMNSAIFTVANGFLLRKPPIKDPNTVVMVTMANPLKGRERDPHVSEVYKKLLKQRQWRLRWAEKAGIGFTLPGHQRAAAETPNGKSGKILEFRKVG